MRKTWYVMEDGSNGDPREIATGADGILVHKDGRKVAYAPHGPRSCGVDLDELSRDVAAGIKTPNQARSELGLAPVGRVMKPAASGPGYLTRDPFDHDRNGAAGGSLPTAERGLDALRSEARGLGISVDNRWGEKRLRDEIAKAQAPAEDDKSDSVD
jgi:hypothetical protein